MMPACWPTSLGGGGVLSASDAVRRQGDLLRHLVVHRASEAAAAAAVNAWSGRAGPGRSAANRATWLLIASRAGRVSAAVRGNRWAGPGRPVGAGLVQYRRDKSFLRLAAWSGPARLGSPRGGCASCARPANALLGEVVVAAAAAELTDWRLATDGRTDTRRADVPSGC